MAATPRSNAEIIFSVFVHIKKGTRQTKISSNARLFICDATSMYTNIQTGPALHCIVRFSLKNEKHMGVPPAVLRDALRLIMTNNVFQIGYTYWLKKVVTAMGAPPAPPDSHTVRTTFSTVSIIYEVHLPR